ncbi:hypothetical protein STRCI_008382 [Streptomyces cinnabarinus]|uniref:Uncharacterized protein n=1 Tax=Streptomyces cinnabarinus TaxID=67287 RepID=A0ABY7KUU7_9ACTN|nr:hypothetical protein [Streptomyces cinnabarinus]WAZ26751.1 hypothetical protein STRCI_008382 [Streptomyces cinnabarinus]
MLLLGEADAMYQQGLPSLHREVAVRRGKLATADLMFAAETAAMRCDAWQDRDEVILLLALVAWEMTPAAMAYAEMAEAGVRRPRDSPPHRRHRAHRPVQARAGRESRPAHRRIRPPALRGALRA